MSVEDFTSLPEGEYTEADQRDDLEIGQRRQRVSRALGEFASDDTDGTYREEGDKEESNPFLDSGSPAARAYARGRGRTGQRRWMEPFAEVDMFGNPTVFSDRFDPSNRGV